ncbi:MULTISPECIES: carbamoyltransferase N-terminal domain-containing protein [unclassified Mesorhizobium]|uniref:carbamoyltransferase N-terminal domain-containing protein n=1 Tax=unclassified Mesorhizobium TaxID=325217 RepID=UPI003339B039
MRICGTKLTHDGAIALVEDGRLVFCVEQEKRHNNPRYQTIDNLDVIVAALAEQGLNPCDVDQFVIDGWDGEDESQFQVRQATKQPPVLASLSVK